jgi:hypothetical protein
MSRTDELIEHVVNRPIERWTVARFRQQRHQGTH